MLLIKYNSIYMHWLLLYNLYINAIFNVLYAGFGILKILMYALYDIAKLMICYTIDVFVMVYKNIFINMF